MLTWGLSFVLVFVWDEMFHLLSYRPLAPHQYTCSQVRRQRHSEKTEPAVFRIKIRLARIWVSLQLKQTIESVLGTSHTRRGVGSPAL